jgi:hypothetical protein
LNIQLQKGNVVCKLEVEAEAGDGEEEQVGDYDPLAPAFGGGALDAELEEGDNSGIWTEPIWYYDEDEEVCSAKRPRLN